MAGELHTEAVVLRGIRYGETDRILHIITPGHGKLGVIARGLRKTKSRFGGILEPLTRVELELRQGRGDLLTLTGASVLLQYKQLRQSIAATELASRACDSVSRLVEEGQPSPAIYNLLCNQLALLDQQPQQAQATNAVAFRLKLLIALGLTPEISACSLCASKTELNSFCASAGGVICKNCSVAANNFPFSAGAVQLIADSLASSLSELKPAELTAVKQVERALNGTVEHHFAVRLKPAYSALIETISKRSQEQK